MAFKRYNGTAWVVITPANMGAEPAFSKNTAFNKNFGSTAETVCEGNDSRLSNARTPVAHTHGNDDLTGIAAWAKAGTKPTYTAAEVGAVTQAEVNTKDVLPYSQHSTGVGNGWRLVAKFNYSASAGDDRKVFRFKVKQGHGNGASYVFWGDYIVGLGTSSQITCSAVLSKSDGTFGKCGYRLDSKNKTLYFYIWTGQYSAYYTSDVTSLTAGTKGTVTWYTEAALTADIVTEGVNTYYPTTTGTLALTSDSRFSDARTPTALAVNGAIGGIMFKTSITGLTVDNAPYTILKVAQATYDGLATNIKNALMLALTY